MEDSRLIQRLALVQQGTDVVSVEAGNTPLLHYTNEQEMVPLIVNFLRSGCPLVQLLVTITRPSSGDRDDHKEDFKEFETRLNNYLGQFLLGKETFNVLDSSLIELTGHDYQSDWAVEVGNDRE